MNYSPLNYDQINAMAGTVSDIACFCLFFFQYGLEPIVITDFFR